MNVRARRQQINYTNKIKWEKNRRKIRPTNFNNKKIAQIGRNNFECSGKKEVKESDAIE